MRNPRSGARFAVSLRDWEEKLWAVRVHPGGTDRATANPYTRAHCLLPRARIEDWLADLRLA